MNSERDEGVWDQCDADPILSEVLRRAGIARDELRRWSGACYDHNVGITEFHAFGPPCISRPELLAELIAHYDLAERLCRRAMIIVEGRSAWMIAWSWGC